MLISTRRTILAAALALALPPIAATAHEKSWPTGPVHLHVGFQTGSSPDTLARLIAGPLSKRLGQPVVVENNEGESGVAGIRQMLAASPDNHAFAITSNGPLTASPRLMSDPGYDVVADIAPVALIATSPLVLAVSTDAAYTDVSGFVRAAQAESGTIRYGSVGQGSAAHLTAELFAAAAGIEMRHVPLASYAEVTSSILENAIEAGFMAPSAALPHVESGTMRILGATCAEASPQMPEAPVMAGQAGLPDDFGAELWNAIIAPAGTDPQVIRRLNAMINDILADPALQEELLGTGWQAQGGTPADLAARIEADTVLWGTMIDRIAAAD
ncbi:MULTISPECIES: tripartite tricarboxylate transporter substrate binding protein [unclassified Paracoccus (in: a-proteobacteria)]|uniref:Bug family tripartite tricarboxylate transporter substrate binding protein n=1 Tax=unclassified Paracoccus (in: a-proteobacteria) TaxID=2688777 RepID=UPI0015FF0A75|nr:MULTISPECIES: tripartite tricarboxylate transporter substrate binding protein [unclassified Paracoccus (in: a-proteobacteria)]MBB1491833.1 tripartite tricarboxylate transporter substrate binding protein [Paracoccus sp. MC1854]MBB1496929.1 tripartite tricarboxylate transporter substrate binding protein [Paracoccus sp. MC1862]QQO45550.1 tripartite tricarboxylate transporter substrate binding protein [Paracoccus sp. MC1862]